jgi:hypothetical protein
MSGYLSRIVQTAAHSSRQLRPLAGSVFGDPAESAIANQSNFNDEVFIFDSWTPASPHGSLIAPRQAANQSSETYLESFQPLQPRRQSPSQPFHENAEKFEPPLTSSKDHLYSAEMPPATAPQTPPTTPRSERPSAGKHAFTPRIAHVPQSVRAQGSAPSALSDSATLDSGNHRADLAGSELRAQPMPSKKTQLDAPAKIIPAQSVQKPTADRFQPPLFRDGQSQPTAEADIEIHIGRIEVLAVQPPVPHAPAPRRDRSTSLADYLARQNGRRT